MLPRFPLVLALAGAFFALSLSPTRADTASDIKALQNAVAALQSQNATQQTQIAALQSQNTSLQSQVTSQQAQLNSVKSTLMFVSRKTDPTRTDGKKGTELYITGMNLHVVNGLGATNGEPSNPTDTANPVVNGLGNVIIGYNALRGDDNSGHSRDVRAGSHNLIVGDRQNYSSCGGIVTGADNTLSGAYASVSGGYANTVSGQYCTVSGGHTNAASGGASSVTGGQLNTAHGDYSNVSGGYGNYAYGATSSISGGQQNETDGQVSSISGGLFVVNNSTYGFAAGGDYSSSGGPGTFHSP